MQKLNTLDMVSFILLIIGGLNWGLVGWVNLNAVANVFGPISMLSRLIYGLIGLAALYLALNVTKFEKK